MRACITSILLILSFSVVFGCMPLVPSHPTKSKSEYYADKKECEKQSRSFAIDSQQRYSITDEMSHTRECLKIKGWSYVKKQE